MPPAPARSGRKFNFQDYALVAVIAILIVVGGILEGSSFVSKDNFFNVLRQGSIVGVLAIGMTFVIATAGIDLSVGSMVAACGVAGGLLVDSGDLAFILGRLGLRRRPGRRQRRGDLLRQGRAVHRDAGACC